jgi:hypothetical protein
MGRPDRVQGDLEGAAGQFSGITDITGLLYGSGLDQQLSATNLAANAIDVSNESLATLSTQTTTLFAQSTHAITVQAVWGIVNPTTGERTIRGGFFYQYNDRTSLIYTTSSVVENKPYPRVGALANFWGQAVNPAIDLVKWFDVVCGNCKK